MTEVFDQDNPQDYPERSAETGDVPEALSTVFPGAEIVASDGEKLPFPAALGEYRPQTETELRFLSLLADCPWTVQGDAAIQMALNVALGDPDKAGEQAEARSVKNLKLRNRRHFITNFALALSTKFADSSGRACPVFAQVEATWPDGEELAYSIGGWGPIGQLVSWFHGEKFPRDVIIVEIPTDKGNPAYRYEDAQ